MNSIKIMQPPFINLPHDTEEEKLKTAKSKTDISMLCALTERKLGGFLHGQYDGIFFKTRDYDIVAKDHLQQFDFSLPKTNRRQPDIQNTPGKAIPVGALGNDDAIIEVTATEISESDETKNNTLLKEIEAFQ
jgi:hypothetical protein